MALDGGTILTKFKGDTSDLDKKTKSTESKLKSMTKSVGSFAGKLVGGITTAFAVVGPFVAGAVSSAVEGAKELEQQIEILNNKMLRDMVELKQYLENMQIVLKRKQKKVLNLWEHLQMNTWQLLIKWVLYCKVVVLQ